MFFWSLLAIFIILILICFGGSVVIFFDKFLGAKFETEGRIVKKIFIAGETERRPYLTADDMGVMRAWPHFAHPQYILNIKIENPSLIKEMMVDEKIFNKVSKDGEVGIICAKGKFSEEIYFKKIILDS
jgi:hypothetical protein